MWNVKCGCRRRIIGDAADLVVASLRRTHDVTVLLPSPIEVAYNCRRRSSTLEAILWSAFNMLCVLCKHFAAVYILRVCFWQFSLQSVFFVYVSVDTLLRVPPNEAVKMSYELIDRKLSSTDTNNKTVFAINNNPTMAADVTASPHRNLDTTLMNCATQRRTDQLHATKSPKLETRSTAASLVKKSSKNSMNVKTVQKHQVASDSVGCQISVCVNELLLMLFSFFTWLLFEICEGCFLCVGLVCVRCVTRKYR
jgi:hypothetical protein